MQPFVETKDQDVFVYHFEDFDFPPHIHSGVEIIYVEEGRIDLKIDENISQIRQNEIGVIFPNQIHCYEQGGCHNKGSLIIIGSHLLPDYADEFSRFHPESPCFPVAGLHPDVFSSYLALLTPWPDYRIAKAYANLLMARIMEDMVLTQENCMSDRIMQRLIEFMTGHYRDPLSLEETARFLGVGKYRLSRIFTHVLHISFTDYLNRLRVEYAVNLIRSTDRTITDIAMDAGFGSIRTFHRAFQKVYHRQPNSLRAIPGYE